MKDICRKVGGCRLKVLNKYLIRVIAEKKGRLFLLLFSICISTALLISSLTAIDIMVDVYVDQAKEDYGEYNVQLKSSNNELINEDDLVIDSKGLDELRMLQTTGYLVDYPEKELRVIGVDINELNQFICMVPLNKKSVEFNGNKVFISKKTAERLVVNVGDFVSLSINQKDEDFEVANIYENYGLFGNDGEESFTVIVPKENLELYSEGKNESNTIFLAVKSDNINDWIQNFNKNNSDISVVASKTYDENQIRSQLEWLNTPMYFMLIITLIMTTFIIYCAFKLIINERLPVFGTFFSQGATYSQMFKLLLKEGVVYGFLGGLFGIIGGVILTNLISNFSIYRLSFAKYKSSSVPIKYLAVGLIFAIIFSLITVALPLIQIMKLSVKDTILNKVDTRKFENKNRFVIGLILIAFAFIFNLFEDHFDYVFSIPMICLYFIGGLLVISFFVKLLCTPLSKLFKGHSVTGMLSLNNVATSKLLMSNITLIAVCVMSITIISSLSNSISDEINGIYGKMNFDICATSNNFNTKDFEDKIDEELDKSDVYKFGMVQSNYENNSLKPINIYYVDPIQYSGFEEYMIYEDKEKQLEELDEYKNGIILCKKIAKNYNINEDDDIELTVNNKTVTLRVISIVDSKMYAGSNYNMISAKTASELFDMDYSTQYYIKTSLSKEEFKEVFKGYGVEIKDKDEIIEDGKNEMKRLTNLLWIFSYITMIMGGFGIVSNVSISFLQRKKELAVMTSIGMKSSSKSVVLLIESAIIGVMGNLVGLIIGGCSLILLTSVFKFLMLDLPLAFPTDILLVTSLSTIILMIIATIPAIKKSLNLDIVKELKYE